MKKTLLATSALAFAGALAAGHAGAADQLSVGISGYMEQWVGMSNFDYMDKDKGKMSGSGFAQHSDSEFYITGALEADSGLTFSVKIQVEGNSGQVDPTAETKQSTGVIDESSMTVQGSFGKITLGADNDVTATMHHGHQDVGVGLNHGDIGGWIKGVGLGGTAGWPADARRISYHTPRISGVQLGVSYAPDASSENSNILPENNDKSAWGIAANVEQAVGDASVKFSVGHHTASQSQTEFMTMTGNKPDSTASPLLTPWAFMRLKGYLMAFDDALSMDDNGHYMGVEGSNVYTVISTDLEAKPPTLTLTDDRHVTDGLSELAHDAARARERLMETMAMPVMAGDNVSFTNAGLHVGFGAFGFNVAWATRDGGAYKEELYVGSGDNGVIDREYNEETMMWDQTAEFMALPEETRELGYDDEQRSRVVKDGSKDSDTVSVGVKYSDGPMAASLGHLRNERGDGTTAEGTMFSFSYILAPGVVSKTSIFQAEDDAATGGDGTGFVTGIRIDF